MKIVIRFRQRPTSGAKRASGSGQATALRCAEHHDLRAGEQDAFAGAALLAALSDLEADPEAGDR